MLPRYFVQLVVNDVHHVLLLDDQRRWEAATTNVSI